MEERIVKNEINFASVSCKERKQKKQNLIMGIRIFLSSLKNISAHFDKMTLRKTSVYFLTLVFLYQAISGGYVQKDFSAPAAANASWYATGGTWSYRKAITVDHTKVPNTNQSNFPMLVSFTDPTMKSVGNGGDVQNASGFDIIFIASDDSTKLDYEMEKYVAATGEVEAWVRIPTLSTSADTTIYMYYGNSSISTSQENKTGVWNENGANNFKAVWHMKETGTNPTVNDSTSSGINSSSQVWTPSIGQIDGGGSFNGSNNYINLGKTLNSALQSNVPFTISSWIKTSSASGDVVTNSSFSTPYIGTEFLVTAGKLRLDITQNANNLIRKTSTASVNNGSWRYVTATNSGSNTAAGVTLYIDGQAAANTVDYDNVSAGALSTTNLEIGARDGTNLPFNGSIDEVHVSNTVRSADWIKTEFNNQSSPSTFYAISVRQVSAAASLSSWGYRKAIKIDHTKISGTNNLNNFPVLINLPSDTGLTTHDTKNGTDILFTLSSVSWGTGTENDRLAHEIESYTSGNGSLQAWVKIPNLSHTDDTTIYMYYGNNAAVDEQNKKLVWDDGGANNDLAVWHMKDTGTNPTVTDSTFNAINSTAQTWTPGTGQIDGGGNLASASSNEIDFGATSGVRPTTETTLSAWVKFTALAGRQSILMRSFNNSIWENLWMSKEADNSFMFEVSNGHENEGGGGAYNEYQTAASSMPSTGQWYYVTGTWKNTGAPSTDGKTYINGNLVSNTVYTRYGGLTSPVLYGANSKLFLGTYNLGSSNYFLNGSLDEVRVSNVARSPDWIKTEYNNQSSPSTFYTVNLEEGGFPVALASWGYRKNITITNSVASDVAGYQVKLTLDTSALVPSKMKADCSDIRFAETDGTNIPYWIESGCGTSTTYVWVKTNLAASAVKSIYMYYGNANAAAASNGINVFDFFDGFDGDMTKWAGDTASYSISNGELVNTPSSSAAKIIYANTSLTGEIIDASIKTTTASTDLQFGLGYRIDASYRAYVCRRNNQYSVRGWGDGMTYYSNYPANGSVQWTSGAYGTDSITVGTTVANSAFKYNGTTIPGVTNLGSNINPGISIYSNGLGTPGAQYIDWVRTRKSIATEPATPTVGAEEPNNVNVLDHFIITGSASQTNGAAQVITITAYKPSGDVYDSLSSETTVRFTGANPIGSYYPTCSDDTTPTPVDVNFGSDTKIKFNSGIATCTLKLYKAETASIGMTYQSYITTALGVTATAGALGTFDVTSPATAYNGTAFNMNIVGKDAYGNTLVTVPGATSVTASSGSIAPNSLSGIQMYLGPDSNQYVHEKDIKISNSLGTTLTDYQVKLTLDTSGVSQTSTCNDIRFTDTSNNNIPYWYESGCGTNNTIVWIKPATLAANADTTIYWYYGNANVSSASSATSVFDLYDDFNTLDNSKWTTLGSVSVSGGTLNITGNGSWSNGIKSVATFDRLTTPIRIENSWKVSVAHQSQSGFGYGTFDVDHSILMQAASGDQSNGVYAYVNGTGYLITYPYTANVYRNGYVIAGANNYWAASLDSSLSVSNTNASNNNVSVIVMQYGNGVTYTTDWVRVRKYATTEPTSVPQATSSSNFYAGSYNGNFTITNAASGSDTLAFTNGDVIKTANVYVDALDYFKIEGSATQAAGQHQTVTITAIGTSGNTYPGYAGSKNITFSGADTIGANHPTCAGTDFGTPTPLTFIAGQVTCPMVLYKTQSAVINITDGSLWATGHTLGVAVAPGASTFILDLPADATAGVPFTANITAADAYGNIVTDYTSNHTITFGGANPIGSYTPQGAGANFGGAGVPLNFSAGAASASLVLYRAETAAVTVSDGTYTAAKAITVSSAALSGIGITHPLNAENGVPFTMTFDGNDQYGNLVNMTDAMALSVNRGGSISPTPIAASSFKAIGPDANLYSYKNAVSIHNANAAILPNHQVKLVLDTSALIPAKLQSDCRDMRFAETDGTNIPYWLEGGCGTANTIVWLKTTLPANTDKIVYMYYGNSTVASASKGSDVFLVFNDASSASEAARWTGRGAALSGSELYISGYDAGASTLPVSINSPWIVETKLRNGSNHAGHECLSISTGNGTDTTWAPNANTFFYWNDNTSPELDYNAGGVSTRLYGSVGTNTYIYRMQKAGTNSYGMALLDTNRQQLAAADNLARANTSVAETEPITSIQINTASNWELADIYVSWVLARNYAAIEPVATFGASITANTTYVGPFTIDGIATAGDVTVIAQSGLLTAQANIDVDSLAYFTVDGPANVAAGYTNEYVLHAYGGSGQVFTGYEGDKTITLSGAASIGGYNPAAQDKSGAYIDFGAGTTVSFTHGEAHLNLKLYKAETAHLGVSDGGINAAGHELAVSVSSTVSRLKLDAPVIVSGVPASVTVTAQDNYGNPATTYVGEHSITFSGAGSVGTYVPKAVDNTGADIDFPGVTKLNFSSGVATAIFKLYKAEIVSVTVSDGTYSAAAQVSVGPAPLASFGINVPSSAKSGIPFSMGLTALDLFGNITTNLSGDTTISVSSGTINGATVPASQLQAFTAPDGQSYRHRKDLTVSSATTVSGYQLEFSLDTQALIAAGKMQDDCDDLRFAEETGTDIPYWIESGCGTANTRVWIRVNLNATPKIVRMYYGNGSVVSAADGSAVFDFFDDFTGSTVDSSRWTTSDLTGITVSGGALRVNNTNSKILSNSVFTQPDILDIKWKRAALAAPVDGWNPGGFWTDANNQLTFLDHLNSRYYRNNNSWTSTAGEFAADTWMKTEYAATAGQVNFRISDYATDADVWNVGSVTNSVSGDSIMIGRRGDEALYNQSGFDGQVDWVLTRKYLAASPSISWGSEAVGGSHTFNVTISGVLQDTPVNLTVTNGSVLSTVGMIVEAADHMNHFKVEGSNSQVAGTNQLLTITAVGESGDPYVLYTGEHTLTLGAASAIGGHIPAAQDKSGSYIDLGQPTVLDFDASGVAHANLRLYKDESVTIGVTDGTYGSVGGNLAIDVNPGPLSVFEPTVPASATSETPFDITLSLKDAYGNVVTDLSGPVTVETNHGAVTPGSIAPEEFVGDGSFAGPITLGELYVNTGVNLTFSYGGVSLSRPISVSGVDHMDHWTMTGNDNQLAGSEQQLTLTAIGKSNNTYTPYSGEKNIIFTGAAGINGHEPQAGNQPLGASIPLSFSSGIASVPLRLFQIGNPTIVATGEYVASKSISVNPAPIASFDLDVPSGEVLSGAHFSMTLIARDAFGNVSTNVSDTTVITVSSGSISPSYIARGYFNDDGVFSSNNFIISGVYSTGQVTVTATCASVSKEGSITVSGVNNMHHYTVGGSANQAAGETQELTLTAILDSGDTDTSWNGTHYLTFSGPSAIDGHISQAGGRDIGVSTPVSFTDGVAKINLQLFKAGSTSVGVSGEGYASSASLSINVTPLAASNFTFNNITSVTSQVPFSLTVTARDIYSNVTRQVGSDIAVTTSDGTVTPTSIAAGAFNTDGTYTTDFTIGDILLDTPITLTFTSGSIIAQKGLNVTGVDETSHFTLTGSASQVAGEEQELTLTAIAVSGNTDIDYEGDHHLVFTGSNSIAGNNPTVNGTVFGGDTLVTFTGGVARVQLKLVKAGRSVINFSEGSFNANGHTLTVDVSPAAASTFTVQPLGSDGTAVVGTPFNITLTAKDAFTNVTTQVADDIMLSASAGTLSPTTIPAAGFLGSGTYSGLFTIQDLSAITPVTVTFTSGTLAPVSRIVTVHPVDEMAGLSLSGSGSQVAGDAQTITIRAIGLSGQVFPDYSGEKDVTFTGPTAVGTYAPTINGLPLDAPIKLVFTNGIAHASLRLFRVEAASLAAADGFNSTQLTVNVTPTPLDSFVLTLPAGATSGTPFPFKLEAFDMYGNIGTNVTSATTLTVSGGTIAPSTLASLEFTDDGKYEGNLTISGVLLTQSVRLTANCAGIVASADIPVTGVDVMDHFTMSGAANQVAGSSQNITITAVGQSGQIFTGYSGDKPLAFSGGATIGTYIPSFTDKDGGAVLFDSPGQLTFTAGVAYTDLTLYKVGTSTIGVTDSTYNSNGHKLSVTVAPSVLYSFAGGVPTVTTSGQPFLLTLHAKDQYGNDVSDVSGLTTLEVSSGNVSPLGIPDTSFENGAYLGILTINNVYTDQRITLTVINGSVRQNAYFWVTGVDLVHHMKLESSSTGLIAGQSVPATVSLLKEDGSVYADYSGLKSITLSGADPIAGHTPTFTDQDGMPKDFGQSGIFSFIDGVASTQLTLYKSGAVTVQASDGYHDSQGHALNLSVVPDALDSFDLSAPTEVNAEESFTIGLTARDQFTNVTNDVNDATLISSSAGTLDRDNIPATAFQADGNYVLSLTLSRIGKDQDVTLTFLSGAITKTVALRVKAPVSTGSALVVRKLDVSSTSIVMLPIHRLGLLNVPPRASMLAVSATPDFKGVSWTDIGKSDEALNLYLASPKVYVKLRSKEGAVSDILTFTQTISSTGSITDIPIVDGDIVKSKNSFDVYIIKFSGGKQYRRLILSPKVFSSYGHLHWENLKLIPQLQLGKFFLSNLVEVKGDRNIYELSADGDSGVRRIFPQNSFFDPDSVYEINSVDRDSYQLVK
jgi:hypothetical protein